MKVITKDFITNVLSKDNAACASIRSGETVVFETYDCFTNQFLPEEATFENVVRNRGIRRPGLCTLRERCRGTCSELRFWTSNWGLSAL